MNKFTHLSLVCILALIVTVGLVQPTEAATLTTLNFTLTTDNGTCLDSVFTIEFGWLAEISDPTDGNDVVGMIAYDGNGVSIAADWNGWSVGTTASETTPISPADQINAMTARPLTIEVYDIVTFPPFGQNSQAIYDDILAQNAPLLSTLIVDPAAVLATCTSLPYISPATPLAVPHLGLVQINTTQAQPVYESAGGGVIRNTDGSELWLPNDADHNGFDTYIVTEVVEIDGAYWIGLFLGNEQWGYVPLAGVTPFEGNLAP